jgi:hypothetical protein
LAHWHAIQFAATVTGRYDFVGSMMENVERVFRSFGAVQKPYFSIFKHPRRVTLRDLASAGKKLLLQPFMPAAFFTSQLIDGVSIDALSALIHSV